MSQVEIRRSVNSSDVAEQASQFITAELVKLLSSKPLVHIALTGGTVGILTLTHLAANEDFLKLDFDRLHIWFGDERYVAGESADRNSNQARATLLDRILIPQSNIHEYPDLDSGLPVDQAAKIFEDQMIAVFEDANPAMDLMILGMGPDGHIASLFPGKSHENKLIVSESDSPKPPPQRLSMSMGMINRSERIVFVVSGIDKAEATEKVHRDPECDLPAAKVQAKVETIWFIDEAAGAAFWSC
jgi:6-phosphogluconolactonase